MAGSIVPCINLHGNIVSADVPTEVKSYGLIVREFPIHFGRARGYCAACNILLGWNAGSNAIGSKKGGEC